MNLAATRGTPRNARAATAALLLFASLAAAAAAQEPAPLRWKLRPGQALHYAMTQETSLESRPAGGAASRVERLQDVEFRWRATKVANGVASMTMTVDRIRVRITGDGRPAPFAFDSASDGPQVDDPYSEKLAELLRGLAGSESTFRMTARGEILDVKLPDSLQALVRRAGAAGGVALFSEEGMRNLIVQAVPFLPEGPVPVGGTWTRQTTAPMPLLGALVVNSTYTDRGPRPEAPGLREVAVDTRFNLQPMPGSPLEMRIVKQSGAGDFAFDAEKGLLESGRLEQSMVMAASAEGQGVERSASTRIGLKLLPNDGEAGAPRPAVEPR